MKHKRIYISLCAVIFCLLLGYGIWCGLLEDDVIWSNEKINGISLNGLTKKEAEASVQEQFELDYQDTAISIRIADKTYKAEIFPLLGMDASSYIRSAYAPGHGKWYARGYEWIKSRNQEMQSIKLLPELTAPELISQVIKETGIAKVNTLKETVCQLTEDSLVIRKGESGVSADIAALEQALLTVMEQQDFDAELTCPVIVTEPKEIDLESYYKQIHKEPVDAQLTKYGDVLPSKSGLTFSLSQAEQQYEAAKEGETITIAFSETEADVQEDDLKELLYRDVLGSCSTAGGGTANRVNNLKLACNACNGLVIAPGETFSFNETLGERTEENGYRSAIVYVNGQKAEGIGGGICQVSSTLFTACLYADLEIVQRSNHSRTVAYLPLGMDAAVSWGGPDFCFRNNTDFPIKLQASYEANHVYVNILGTKEQSETVEITTEAIDALTVRTYREHYNSQGELLEKEEVAYSHYLG